MMFIEFNGRLYNVDQIIYVQKADARKNPIKHKTDWDMRIYLEAAGDNGDYIEYASPEEDAFIKDWNELEEKLLNIK